MQETEVQLGDLVEDQISEYEGVVHIIGDHITGCTRIGCLGASDPTNPDKESFFYEEQLEVKNQEVDADPQTECEFETGQPVIDVVTGFSGVVSVINYCLYNCPQILVQPTDEEDPEWFDAPRLRENERGVSHETTFDDLEAVSETGSISDSPTTNLSK